MQTLKDESLFLFQQQEKPTLLQLIYRQWSYLVAWQHNFLIRWTAIILMAPKNIFFPSFPPTITPTFHFLKPLLASSASLSMGHSLLGAVWLSLISQIYCRAKCEQMVHWNQLIVQAVLCKMCIAGVDIATTLKFLYCAALVLSSFASTS